MKILLLLFLIVVGLRSSSIAQEIKVDSSTLKTKTAISDVKHFKLKQSDWKEYRKNRINSTSDYFKPTTANAVHPDWLTDSIYVKAYRNAAFEKTVKRRTVSHYLLFGGGISVSVIDLIFFEKQDVQEINFDSSSIKKETAYQNSRNFKLNKKVRKAYRNHSLTNTSDYFNPTIQTASNTVFLKDSVYVLSYKNGAYQTSVRKIKLKRKIIIVGTVYVTCTIAVGILIVKLFENLADSITRSVY